MITIIWHLTVTALAILGGLSVIATLALLVMAIADDRAAKKAGRREAKRFEVVK